MKKFSRIAYQEELIEKILLVSGKSNAELEDSTNLSHLFASQEWIVFELGQQKYKIPFRSVYTINNITKYTTLPAIHPQIFGLANLNTSEIVLVDINAWHKKEISHYFKEKIPKEFLSITLRGERLGICCKAFPAESTEKISEYPVFDAEEFLSNITKT